MRFGDPSVEIKKGKVWLVFSDGTRKETDINANKYFAIRNLLEQEDNCYVAMIEYIAEHILWDRRFFDPDDDEADSEGRRKDNKTSNETKEATEKAFARLRDINTEFDNLGFSIAIGFYPYRQEKKL